MSLHLTQDGATQAWDDLAQRLERFVTTWAQGREPTITEFLPAEPLTLRRLVLVELVKADLEQRTARGQTRILEQYAAEFPELLENGEPACDLIYEEYHIRRTAGHDVSPRDYYQRFPRSTDALKRLLGTEDFSATTQLFTGHRTENFAAGQRLDEFDLLVELGKGAFGSVFLARQLSMQRLVALKVSADKGNEPQTLATLDHPNIVRVYDQRSLPAQRVRLLYMQFAPGGTLAEVARRVRQTPPAARTGRLLVEAVNEAVSKTGMTGGDDSPWKRRLSATAWPEVVCRLGIQLAQALAYAHLQGVLHRDVKPANVLLSGDGSPKLADFNISFCSQLDGASPAAYFGGSLAYMSPEQLEACNPTHDRQPDSLDGRSDLYALAVVLWELLYGERPFADDEMTSGWSSMLTAMAARRRTEAPVLPSKARDPITVRLEQVLRKALSSDPGQRQTDGNQLARELSLCLNPRAWDLVNDLKSGWRDWARRHPLLALVPINLPPFVLAGAFNWWFNVAHQGNEIKKMGGGPAFEMLKIPVNAILYPLGVGVVLYYAVPVARTIRHVALGDRVPEDQVRKARRRSITLGHVVAAVGMTLWMIAGLAFPIGIHIAIGRFPGTLYLWFLLSMFACGMVSSCLPFLATTWLSVRVFFPALLANTAPDPDEQRRLTALVRYAGWYLVASTVAPVTAVLLILLTGEDRLAIALVVAATIIGFGAAYYVYQRIRADLIALSVVTRPADMIGTTTDTVETF